jgi:photosystem II stability/assembly factor-like uncharacterized protein
MKLGNGLQSLSVIVAWLQLAGCSAYGIPAAQNSAARWQHETSGTTLPLVEVGPGNDPSVNVSAADIYAIGQKGCGVVFHREPTLWRQVLGETCYYCVTCKTKGSWSGDSVSFWVTADENVARRSEGATSEELIATPAQHPLRAIWGRSPTDVFAVGDHGTIVHFDGTAWTLMNDGDVADDLRAVEGDTSGRLFVVGTNGTVLQLHGSSWEREDASAVGIALNDLTLLDSGEVIVVGDQGTILVRR